MAKINISGTLFLGIALLVTFMLISSNQITIVKSFQSQLSRIESPFVQIEKEFQLKTGIKEAAFQGTDNCYIVEPVYAHLQCHQVVGGLYQNIITPAGVNSTSDAVAKMTGVVSIVDLDLSKYDFGGYFDLLGFGFTQGKAYRVDWQKVAAGFNIRKATIYTAGVPHWYSGDRREDIHVYVDTGSKNPAGKPILRRWYISAQCPKQSIYNYCAEYPEKDVNAIYFFRTPAGWNGAPVTDSNWKITFDADDWYLSYSVPGQLDPTRIASDKCYVMDLVDSLAQKAKDPFTALPPEYQMPDLGSLKAIYSQKNYAGSVLSDNIPDTYKVFYREAGFTNGPDGLVAVYPNVVSDMNRDGASMNWVYLYRNTGVPQGITARKYDTNGDGKQEDVLCDYLNKRVLVLSEIQTLKEPPNGECYSYPTKSFQRPEWKTAEYFFACGQDICTSQGSVASPPKPVFDEANLRCVSADTPVVGTRCYGPQDCKVTTKYLHQDVGGNCLAFDSECVPDAKASPYTGFCKDSTTTLPTCCPGDRLPSGAYCNQLGTQWVDAPTLDRTPCPVGMCCVGDPYYLDSKTVDGQAGTAENQYGCESLGNSCCGDMDSQTRANCAISCASVSTDKTIADQVIDKIMASLGLDKLVAAAGTFGTIIMWILIVIIVILAIWGIMWVINTILPILKTLFTVMNGGNVDLPRLGKQVLDSQPMQGNIAGQKVGVDNQEKVVTVKVNNFFSSGKGGN